MGNRMGISHTPRAVSRQPPDRSTLSDSLVNNLKDFRDVTELVKMERAIASNREKVDLLPDDHPDRVMALNKLGLSLLRYFMLRNKIKNLEQSLSTYQSPGDPHLSQMFKQLAIGIRNLLSLMPAETEDPEDSSISCFRDAVSLCPPSHPDRFLSLNCLAEGLMNRYHHRENMADLEEAILHQRNILSLCPPGHCDRATSLNDLANTLRILYNKSGKIEDLEESISLNRDAHSFCEPDFPFYPVIVRNLASTLKKRYHQFGKIEDLQDSISFHRHALSLHTSGDPHRSTILHNLAHALHIRYSQLSIVEDLEVSVSFYREALGVAPSGDPDSYMTLINLASALVTRYDRWGKIEDLEDSLSFSRDALSLSSPGHPKRFISLNSLAATLMTRYKQLGKTEDLEESIILSRDALKICDPHHADHSAILNNLAYGLNARHSQLGKIEDLEDSVSLYRNALSLTPLGHPHRFHSLNNFAAILMARYNRFGKMEDLEDSISFLRDALCLQSPDHENRFMGLSNLANCLSNRYRQMGKIEDLDESLLFYRDALRLFPPGHLACSTIVNNLAGTLIDRYHHLGQIEDLEESISFHYKALSLRSSDHPRYATTLNNLGVSLLTRHKKLGKIEDVEESISFCRNALSLCVPGHFVRCTTLNNLADALCVRYEQSGKIEDLEESLSLYYKGLDLRPLGHPGRSRLLRNLATTHMICFDHLRKVEDLQKGICFYEQATCDSTSYLQDRITAANNWAECARNYRVTSSELSAYTNLLDLINRGLISRPSVESQQQFLATARIPRSIAADAASAAIEADKVNLAVEFLEQGRSILWSRVNAYKHPLEQLRQAEGGGELADRLETLGAELERLALISNKDSELEVMFDEKTPTKVRSDEDQMKRHRILSEEWEEIVARVREIEGFSHFLQAPPFETLRSAAAEGPVILVNISNFHSEAIIIQQDNSPVLVKLPDVQLKEVRAQKLGSSREIGSTLRYLWDGVVSPIVDCLDKLGLQKQSRIWWCPTGELCALPLHAAGRGKRCLHDIYISSYTSTLSSLIRARSNISQSPIIPKLLIIGQPSTDLKRVQDEVDLIASLRPGADILFGPEANHEAVFEGLKQHSWVHFACHGHLGNNDQPFHASFKLYDQPLLLLDLIKARIPNAEFAFLSVCHSAEGDSRTPDESIHLSAALQFCGFRSVVGTLWEMDDEDGPTISNEFYTQMFSNPDKIDFKDSARALNKAIKAMKKAKVPLDRLALFVHIGA